jgi:hypothetical protein
MAGGGHLATHLKALRASLDRHVADHKTTPTCYNKSGA